MSRREIHTPDMPVQQPADILLRDGTAATGGQSIVQVEKVPNQDYLDALAFMEEEIEVLVHETADENADNPVIVGCNGEFRQFFRGVATRAKRKFVNCLIVKTGRVSTPEYINGAGERARKIAQTSAHKYPFTVISDPNPKGVQWLRARMAEAV